MIDIFGSIYINFNINLMGLFSFITKPFEIVGYTLIGVALGFAYNVYTKNHSMDALAIGGAVGLGVSLIT